jgi:hypothetical protein
MMAALDSYMASRREFEDFKAKVQQAREDAEDQMARTRATPLGTLPEARGNGSATAPATSWVRRRTRLPAEVGFDHRRMEGDFAPPSATSLLRLK